MSDKKLLKHPLVTAEIKRQVGLAVSRAVEGYVSPTIEGFEFPAPPEPPKPAKQSKTLWFNALVVVLTLLAANVDQLQPYVSAETFVYLGTFAGVVNLFLRLVTSRAIATGTKSEGDRG